MQRRRTSVRRRRGVIKMPRKLPNAELKMAPASFPPTARVRITAEDTGGGMHAMTCSLRARWRGADSAVQTHEKGDV